MLKGLFISVLAFSSLAYGVEIENNGSAFLTSMVHDSLNSLPSDYLESITKKITIEEKAFKSDSLFASEDLCSFEEGIKFGVTKKRKISISKRLVELAQTNSNSYKCGHKTFRNMLKAVLVHELTHIKDNQEKISIDPDFQRIVGMKKVQRNSKKHLMNQNVSTSPDAYEFLNLEESLAVNTEYLVMDPEFECRKPATAKFLSKRLHIPLKGQCIRTHKVLAQSAYLEDNYQLAVNIDPSRIYQVHYLFAGKGKSIMSRWGHAMFRLVVCAPYRKQVGPECLNDVSHHLALSYRAYMSDINISYTKGVFGGYPSQLFIMRYLEVQQEYTKYELRDLYSVPLKMTAEQKSEFLDLTLERFWTYQGRYYFLDNNCGTETAKHLAVALDEEESKLIGSITPLKIYKDIIKQKNDLSEEKIEGLSRDEMIQKRFLVESMFETLDESYQFLRQYLPSFSEKKMDKFLKKTTADIRLRDYENFARTADNLDLNLRKQIVMKLVYLERYLAGRFLSEIPKKAIQKMNKDAELKAQVMKMGETMKLLSVQPWEVINSRYGVPTAAEVEVQFPQFLAQRNEEVKESMEDQMSNLQSIMGKTYFEKELYELDVLKKIKTLTSELINQVNNIH